MAVYARKGDENLYNRSFLKLIVRVKYILCNRITHTNGYDLDTFITNTPKFK